MFGAWPSRFQLLQNVAQLGFATADTSGPEWEHLRRLLLADPQTTQSVTADAVPALVAAAKNGEVVTLAAQADPRLATALARDVRRQTLVDGCLELALTRVANAFEREGIDQCCLLKGSASALMLYPSSALRVRRDIDVLVSRAQFLHAIEALNKDGWTPDVSPMTRLQGPARSRDWSMTLELPVGQISCDLHQRLFPGGRFPVDHRGFLARAERGPHALPVPALEDLFLHTTLHIARNAFLEPYKAWWDLVLVSRQPSFSWERLAATAKTWRGQTGLWAVLGVLQRWFNVSAPTKVLHTIQPDPVRRRILRRLLSGGGGFALRHHVSRLAATAVFAPLLADDVGSLVHYAAEVAQRRIDAAVAQQLMPPDSG